MFLDNGIDELPDEFAGPSFKDPSLLDPDDGWYELTIPPPNLCPLGAASWPEHVVAHIEKIFTAEGLPKPRETKLVEPYAIAFGGKNNDGAADLGGVNWQKVLDYFSYELASMMGRTKDIKAAQEAAVETYGHMFIHYAVYEVGY